MTQIKHTKSKGDNMSDTKQTQNLTTAEMTGFNRYRTTTSIRAVQIHTEFVVDTLEGTFTGKPGDWLAEGVAGERYIIADAIFQKTYRRIDHAR